MTRNNVKGGVHGGKTKKARNKKEEAHNKAQEESNATTSTITATLLCS